MNQPQAPIPQLVSQLTTDWLTQALREGGQLREGRVHQARVEPLGDGEGFMGVVARLHLEYAPSEARGPNTLIAKMPSPLPENRTLGELTGAYWREILFYRELSAAVPIRTPRHYHSALTPDPMRRWQDAIVAVLDHLPDWLVDRVMNSSRDVVNGREHHYLLLIEDLAPARPGNQLQACAPERCEQVLSAAAALHAGFWRNKALKSHYYLTNTGGMVHIRHRMYQQARSSFIDSHGDQLLDGDMRLFDWYDRHGIRLARRLYQQTPATLVHGDMRLDNVFFDATSATDPVVLADWQLLGRGPGVYDVAYFLSGALDVSTSREVELALVRHYHEALRRHGVTDYPWERLARDYDAAVMLMLGVLATTGNVDVGQDRGLELMRLWIDRALARARNLDLNLLTP